MWIKSYLGAMRCAWLEWTTVWLGRTATKRAGNSDVQLWCGMLRRGACLSQDIAPGSLWRIRRISLNSPLARACKVLASGLYTHIRK